MGQAHVGEAAAGGLVQNTAEDAVRCWVHRFARSNPCYKTESRANLNHALDVYPLCQPAIGRYHPQLVRESIVCLGRAGSQNLPCVHALWTQVRCIQRAGAVRRVGGVPPLRIKQQQLVTRALRPPKPDVGVERSRVRYFNAPRAGRDMSLQLSAEPSCEVGVH